ncbi:MAG: alpha/beta hydrolase [Rhodospirillales bacterium]|nr:alpha/beta hydrolase [Alphaproteobacteria bacterium]USO06560.1 MAG: alpha/beta hydrolase [Rhodospirillales bacterium]
MAEDLAKRNGLQKDVVQTQNFAITAYHSFKDNKQPLRIYIEGDGLAYRSRSKPSKDPTPRDPVVLKLMIVDNYTNKAYLARPCHYSQQDLLSACSVKNWTTERFSPVIIRSMNEAVSKLKEQNGARDIELIGFSGGGAVAVLIAALRDDVKSIRTVAGNLDHAAFTKHHDVTPLDGSLNPVDVASRIAHIPQIHFSGQNDTVVPLSIAESYLHNLHNKNCIKIQTVPHVTHGRGWSEVWNVLLDIPFALCIGPHEKPSIVDNNLANR